MGINYKKSGFSVVEILVTVVLIGTLIGIAVVSLAASKKKTRDTERKADLAEIGRFFTVGCYLPESGGGEYDLSQIIDGLLKKYPEQKKYLSGGPIWDPQMGSESITYYKYSVADDGKHCVLYANMENSTEIVTLPDISVPTMGGRTGVFEATEKGWNGSKKYYQVSK